MKFSITTPKYGLALALAMAFATTNHSQASASVPISQDYIHENADELGFSPSKLNDLRDGFLQDVKTGVIPGANVLIARKGQIVAQFSVGYAHLETKTPLTSDHLFRLYSMTKPVAAAIALQQIDEGAYGLDSRIDTFLPELSQPKVHTEKGLVDAVQPVTMRHLLTHTAGYTAEWGWDSVAPLYREKGIVEYATHNYDNAAESLTDFVERLADVPLAHQPGSKRTYGTSNDVQGLFMARVDNTSAEDLFHDRLGRPLGMTDTNFCVDQSDLSTRLTSMYRDEEGTLKLIENGVNSKYACPTKVVSYSGGLAGTISDYYRFAQMLLDNGQFEGKQVMSANSVKLLSTPQQFVHEGDWIKGADWGLSVAVVTDASKSARAEVNGNYYWSGSASTSFWVDPTNEIVALFFTQVRNSTAKPSIQTRFRNRVYEAFSEYPSK